MNFYKKSDIFNSPSNKNELGLTKLTNEFSKSFHKFLSDETLSSFRKKRISENFNSTETSNNSQKLSEEALALNERIFYYCQQKEANPSFNHIQTYKEIFIKMCSLSTTLTKSFENSLNIVPFISISKRIIDSKYFFDDIVYQALILTSIVSSRQDGSMAAKEWEEYLDSLLKLLEKKVYEINMMKANVFIEKILLNCGNILVDLPFLRKNFHFKLKVFHVAKNLLARNNQKIQASTLWLLNLLVKEMPIEEAFSFDQEFLNTTLMNSTKGVQGGEIKLDEEIFSETFYLFAFLSSRFYDEESKQTLGFNSKSLFNEKFPLRFLTEIGKIFLSITVNADLGSSSTQQNIDCSLLPILTFLANSVPFFSEEAFVTLFSDSPNGLGILEIVLSKIYTSTLDLNPFSSQSSFTPKCIKESIFLLNQLITMNASIKSYLSKNQFLLKKIQEFENGSNNFRFGILEEIKFLRNNLFQKSN